MNIQFLDSEVVPLSSENRTFMLNRDIIIDHYFSGIDEPDSNQHRVRPRSSDMSANGNDGFKQLHKCKSQARGLVDLALPESSGNESPKSATQFPRRGGGDGFQPLKFADNKTKTARHSTNRSSFPFPSLPSPISRSIPIASSSLKRTASELQLVQDEAMADYRDFCMYMRIVNGMKERRSFTQLPSANGEIQNIIRTRHNPVQEGPSSYMREGLERHSVNSPLNPPKVVTTSAVAPALAAPSLTEIMTPCYNHTTRKPRRTPAIVIQEPTADFIDDNNLIVIGRGMSHDAGKRLLPCFPQQNIDSLQENDDPEEIFVMDDV